MINIAQLAKKRQINLNNTTRNLQTQNNMLIDTLKLINQSMHKLSDKIQNISVSVNTLQSNSSSKENISSNSKYSDQRFQEINIDIPQLQGNQSEERRVLDIEYFLGKICKKIFSVGFSMLRKQILDDQKVKVFCSEKLLEYILKFIRKNNLGEEQVQQINKCLQEKILPYFQAKYPLSEEAPNTNFSNFIVAKDNIDDQENDLIFRSGIQFKLKKSKNYNEEIMRVINYLIDTSSEEQKQFSQKMSEFFQKIYDKSRTVEMQRFDPKVPQNFKKQYHLNQTAKITQQKEKQKNEEEIDINIHKTNEKYDEMEYRQKVKAFTSYQIGKKLPDHFRKFSEKEMESNDFNLNDPSMMRIATKWCEQLEKYYRNENILNRQKPFRMRDKTTDFMKNKWMLEVLSALLQKSYKIYPEQYLKKIKKHSNQAQTQFAKQDKYQQLSVFSQQEAIVGNFSAIMFRNYENYLKGYLNSLIHGIMVALQQFQQVIKYKHHLGKQIKSYQKNKTNFNLSALIKRANQFSGSTSVIDHLIPSLITFKIGDLLRCKCSSKEEQIKALYSEIQRISYLYPQQLRIVRIKNRLQKGTKDILINMLYKNKIVVEMQLAIKIGKSKFIESSNKFCHYLYELQRAQFGSINEMCSIWVGKDGRSTFFMQNLDKNNIRKPQFQKKIPKKRYSRKTILSLPFKCSACDYYYFDCQQFQKHAEFTYQNDKKKICFFCWFEEKNIGQKKHMLDAPMNILDGKQIQFLYAKHNKFDELLKMIPHEGWIVNLKESNRKLSKLVRYDTDQKILLLTCSQNEQFNLIAELDKSDKIQNENKNNFKFQKLLFENIIIMNKDPEEYETRLELINSIKKSYIMPEYLSNCYKMEKNSISITRQNIDCSIFIQNHDAKPKHFVRKLNLSENCIEKVQLLTQKFPDLKVLMLNYNQIKQLPSIKNQWKQLQKLSLSGNQINVLPIQFCRQFKQLQQLDLDLNQLEHLPQQLGLLTQLRSLDLSGNKIQNLPTSISQLTKLEVLSLPKNSLKSLNVEVKYLKNLRKINLSQNLLKDLPEEIGELVSLKILVLSKNNLQSLPKSIVQLKSLMILDVSSNQSLTYLPDDIGKLQSLTLIDATSINLLEIPESIGKLHSLKQFQVGNNNLKKLPDSIGQLISLRNFKFNRNKNVFQDFPQSLYSLQISEFIYSPSNVTGLVRQKLYSKINQGWAVMQKS